LAAFCEQTDFLDRDAVLRLAENCKHSPGVWYLLNFALWWKEYIQESQRFEDCVAGRELPIGNSRTA